MKSALIMFAAIAAVQCGITRNVRQVGWPAPSTTIDVAAALAAAAAGSAAEGHNENVQVTGAGGWGPIAQIDIAANGGSFLDQEGSILQVTNQDSQSALSLNEVSVGQIGAAEESEVVDALGLDISNSQNGWAEVSGEGASAADAASSVIIQPAAANLGMASP